MRRPPRPGRRASGDKVYPWPIGRPIPVSGSRRPREGTTSRPSCAGPRRRARSSCWPTAPARGWSTTSSKTSPLRWRRGRSRRSGINSPIPPPGSGGPIPPRCWSRAPAPPSPRPRAPAPTCRSLRGASRWAAASPPRRRPRSPWPGRGGSSSFGFPLHAAAAPATKRGDHLARTGLPLLFLQGERDKLADLLLLRPIVAALGPRARLQVVPEGDHSFAVPKRTGRTAAEVIDWLAQQTRTFVLVPCASPALSFNSMK